MQGGWVGGGGGGCALQSGRADTLGMRARACVCVCVCVGGWVGGTLNG